MIGIHARRTFAAATIAFMFLSSVALAAINPIPGVDVIVKKNPGGTAFTVKTDKNGRFTVSGLTPGEYDFIWNIQAKTSRAPINTTRSNIKRPSISVANHASNGTQQVTLMIQAGTDAFGQATSGSTADSHQRIVITAKQGVISGTIVSVSH